MSSNLTVEPVHRKKYADFSTELKFALRKRFGEPVNTQLSHDAIDYLLGLEHAGIKDAKKLIEMIVKHDLIIVKEEY